MIKKIKRTEETNIDIELCLFNHEGKKYIESEISIYISQGILTFNLDIEETEKFMKEIEETLKEYKKLKNDV